MAKRPQRKKSRQAAEGASRLSSLVATTAKGLLSPSAGVVLAAAGPVAALGIQVFDLFGARQGERATKLLETLYLERSTDRTFAAAVAAELRDPLVREVLLESVRASIESISEEVIPAIAAIEREYQRKGLHVDGFFRGYCRTLQDLVPAEYRVLVYLVRQASQMVANEKDEKKVQSILLTVGQDRISADLVLPHSAGEFAYRPCGRLPSQPDAERVLRLAAANCIGAMDARTQPTWTIRVEVLERIDRLLSPRD